MVPFCHIQSLNWFVNGTPGELKYVDDVSPLPDELFGFVVQSTKANAAITSIDASAALVRRHSKMLR